MSSHILSELVDLNAGVLQDTWLGPCTSIHHKPAVYCTSDIQWWHNSRRYSTK